MRLFSDDAPRSILPFEGEVIYHGPVFSPAESLVYLDTLLETTQWKNDEVFIFGRHIVTKRKTAWYGDQPFSYTYSGFQRTALPWTKILLDLKNRVESISGDRYNSCLLNLYHDGTEGMSWHSDDEPELDADATIASLSFGAERRFLFRHKRSKESKGLLLENGSMLIMRPPTQTYWQHRLPPTTKITSPRVNLTFRRMREQ